MPSRTLRVGAGVAIIGALVALVWWPRGGPEEAKHGPETERRAGSGARDRLTVGVTPAVVEDDPPGTLVLEGQVIDETEAPVGGAVVSISSVPPRLVTTEDDGSFSVSGLISREYALAARATEGIAGPVSVRLSATSEPVILRLRRGAQMAVRVVDASTGRPVVGARVELRAATDLAAVTDALGVARLAPVDDGPNPVAVSAAGYATAHVSLRARPEPVVVELGPEALVSGVVRDSRGRAVAGARVWPARDGELFAGPDPRRDGVVTGDRGTWQMTGLAPGTYTFSASCEGYAAAEQKAVAVPSTGVSDVVLVLGDGVRVSGRVTRDGDSAPYSTVRLTDAEPTARPQAREVRADADGRFSIAGVAPRQVVITAWSDAAASIPRPLDLRAGSDVAGVELTLSAGGVISGVVVFPDGEPVPEAQVVAMPATHDAAGSTSLRVRGLPADTADSGGRFSVVGLLPGAYTLRAIRPGDRDPAAPWRHAGVVARPGDVKVRLELPRDGGIRGSVSFQTGGVPELFAVTVGGQPARPFATEDGTFEITDVPSGSYVVAITGPTFRKQFVGEVVVPVGRIVDMGRLVINRGRTIRGRVVDVDGVAIPGAVVVGGTTVVGASSSIEHETAAEDALGTRRIRADERGHYELRGMGSGRLFVLADANAGRSAPVDLPPGQDDVTQDLIVVATGELRGRLTLAGAPVGGAIVTVLALDTPGVTFVVAAGDDGAFAFERLSPGRYAVSGLVAFGERVTMETVLASVAAADVAHTDIAMPAGPAELVVRAARADGNALHGQVVVKSGAHEVTNADQLNEADVPGTMLVAPIDSDRGSTRFGGLSPGLHTACVLALPGPATDPDVAALIEAYPERIELACARVELADDGDEHVVTLEVP